MSECLLLAESGQLRMHPDPKFGYPAFFGLLSVRYRPKADTREFTFLGNNHINTA